MISKFSQMLSHPLFSGSFVMVFGSNFANLIAYIYHIIFGRILGPERYGDLSAILSILGILFSIFGFISTVIVKFVSSSDKNELKLMYSWFIKKLKAVVFFISLTLFLFTPVLSNFLHIDLKIVVLVVPTLIFAIYGFLYRSFLQGLLKFKEVVFATTLDIATRLLLGWLLIYLGLSVFGAVTGILVSTLVSFLFLRYFLRDLRLQKVDGDYKATKEMLTYSLPVFIATVATISMFSSDVILVKHFFNSHEAGIYASLSTLGKIIFYGAGPVGAVMFPIISKRYSKGQSYKKVFSLSILMTFAICFGILTLYFLFPRLSVSLLYGDKYLDASSYLVWFGLFMSLFTLGSLFASFFLSKNDTKIAGILVVSALLQISGIWFFHGSILTVVKISTLSSFLMLTLLLVYFAYGKKFESRIKKKTS